MSAYQLWIDNAHGSQNVEFSSNTIVNSTQYGGIVNEISSFTAHNNLAANDAGNAFGGFSGCACSNNASEDGTGDVNWKPSWQDTTWTPNNGSPWSPPPANYYKPNGIASTFGYQGTVGP